MVFLEVREKVCSFDKSAKEEMKERFKERKKNEGAEDRMKKEKKVK